PLMTSSDALGFGPSGLEGRPGSPGAPRAPKSSIQHYGVAGRAGGADDAERRPDEGALVDLPVDQRLGVDVLQVPDAAAGLHLAVAGHGEVLSLLARRLGVARGGVAHGQRDVPRGHVLAGADPEAGLALAEQVARGLALVGVHALEAVVAPA